MECCALLGIVGEVVDGEADGVSKFGSMEQGRRVQEEFPPIGRFVVENTSQFLNDVDKEQSWFIALLNAQKEGKSLAPFSPQTLPCPSSGLRELADRFHDSVNTIVLFCDNYAIDVNAKDFGEVNHSKHVFCQYLHVRCPCYLEQKKMGDAEGKFVDFETMANNTLTKAIDQFEHMVIAVEPWRQTLAGGGTSKRTLFDNEFKIHFEKLAQIYKIAVGQFGALAVEGCTVAEGHEKQHNDHVHVQRFRPRADYEGPEQRTRESLHGFVGADSGCLQSSRPGHSDDKYEDEFAQVDGQLDVANLMAQCTICEAKFACFVGARACARPLKLLETREGDQGEQVRDDLEVHIPGGCHPTRRTTTCNGRRKGSTYEKCGFTKPSGVQVPVGDGPRGVSNKHMRTRTAQVTADTGATQLPSICFPSQAARLFSTSCSTS